MLEDYRWENYGQTSGYLQEYRHSRKHQSSLAHKPSCFPSYEFQRKRCRIDSKEFLDRFDQKQSLVHMGQRHRSPRASRPKEQHGQIPKKSDPTTGQKSILNAIEQRKRQLIVNLEERGPISNEKKGHHGRLHRFLRLPVPRNSSWELSTMVGIPTWFRKQGFTRGRPHQGHMRAALRGKNRSETIHHRASILCTNHRLPREVPGPVQKNALETFDRDAPG